MTSLKLAKLRQATALALALRLAAVAQVAAEVAARKREILALSQRNPAMEANPPDWNAARQDAALALWRRQRRLKLQSEARHCEARLEGLREAARQAFGRDEAVAILLEKAGVLELADSRRRAEAAGLPPER